MGAAALAVVRHSPALTLTSFRSSEHREREPESIITELNALALLRDVAIAGVMDSGFLAEPVIGPATSGRTRWLGPGMTLCQIRASPLAPALLPHR
jgi:hypothetical protein